jgi:hypothetical protein
MALKDKELERIIRELHWQDELDVVDSYYDSWYGDCDVVLYMDKYYELGDFDIHEVEPVERVVKDWQVVQ